MKGLSKSILFGLIGSVSLLALYFAVMLLARSSVSEALLQLKTVIIWVIPLVLTFGMQVGLYVYIKDCAKKHAISGTQTTVSTATSGTAMLACCAHHLTDILPILGLSILSTFLAKYQVWFLGIGIASNIVGIAILIKQLYKMK